MRTPMLVVLLVAAVAGCGGSEFQSGAADEAGADQSSGPEAGAADDGHDDATANDGDARTPAHDAGTDDVASDEAQTIPDAPAVDDGGDACTLVQHSDGPGPTGSTTLGQTFFDCVPFGTYNQQLADDACQAWGAANGGIIMQVTYSSCSDGTTFVYCVDQNATPAKWAFAGPALGHVCVACGSCPTSADPTYE